MKILRMKKMIAIIAAISLALLPVTPAGWAVDPSVEILQGTGVSTSGEGQLGISVGDVGDVETTVISTEATTGDFLVGGALSVGAAAVDGIVGGGDVEVEGDEVELDVQDEGLEVVGGGVDVGEGEFELHTPAEGLDVVGGDVVVGIEEVQVTLEQLTEAQEVLGLDAASGVVLDSNPSVPGASFAISFLGEDGQPVGRMQYDVDGEPLFLRVVASDGQHDTTFKYDPNTGALVQTIENVSRSGQNFKRIETTYAGAPGDEYQIATDVHTLNSHLFPADRIQSCYSHGCRPRDFQAGYKGNHDGNAWIRTSYSTTEYIDGEARTTTSNWVYTVSENTNFSYEYQRVNGKELRWRILENVGWKTSTTVTPVEVIDDGGTGGVVVEPQSEQPDRGVEPIEVTLPAPIQSYIDQLQLAVEDRYHVAVEDLEVVCVRAPCPSRYSVNIVTLVFEPGILQSLSFTLSEDLQMSDLSVSYAAGGNLFTTHSSFRTVNLSEADAQTLFEGMKRLLLTSGRQLTGPADPIALAINALGLMTRITVSSVDQDGTIYFERDGVSYKCYENSQGNVILQEVVPSDVVVDDLPGDVVVDDLAGEVGGAALVTQPELAPEAVVTDFAEVAGGELLEMQPEAELEVAGADEVVLGAQDEGLEGVGADEVELDAQAEGLEVAGGDVTVGEGEFELHTQEEEPEAVVEDLAGGTGGGTPSDEPSEEVPPPTESSASESYASMAPEPVAPAPTAPPAPTDGGSQNRAASAAPAPTATNLPDAPVVTQGSCVAGTDSNCNGLAAGGTVWQAYAGNNALQQELVAAVQSVLPNFYSTFDLANQTNNALPLDNLYLLDNNNYVSLQSDFLYQLQASGYESAQAYIDALSQSDYEIAVIDYSFDGTQEFAYTPAQIQQVISAGTMPLSYISIGEASDFRSPPFWNPDWVANPPSWLGNINPDWPESRKVRFWEPEWFTTVVQPYLDSIIAAGFEGVYLDIIDAYEYWGDNEMYGTGEGQETWTLGDPGTAEEPGGEEVAAQRMIAFVNQIADYCRAQNPDFLIVPQNGAGIIQYDTGFTLGGTTYPAGGYLNTVSGIGVESVWSSQTTANDPLEVAERLSYLDQFVANGLMVLSVDYVDDGTGYTGDNRTRIDNYTSLAAQHGFNYFAGRTDLALDTMNTIPGQTLPAFSNPRALEQTIPNLLASLQELNSRRPGYLPASLVALITPNGLAGRQISAPTLQQAVYIPGVQFPGTTEHYAADGTLLRVVAFDANGRIDSVVTSAPARANEAAAVIRTYDNAHTLFRVNEYHANGNLSRSINHQPTGGFTIVEETFDLDGNLAGRVDRTQTLDGQGRVISENAVTYRVLSDGGDLLFSTNFTTHNTSFDADNNPLAVRVDRLNESGSAVLSYQKSTFVYINGLVTQETREYFTGVVLNYTTVINNTYHADGRPDQTTTVITDAATGVVFQETTTDYVYDGSNNLVSATWDRTTRDQRPQIMVGGNLVDNPEFRNDIGTWNLVHTYDANEISTGTTVTEGNYVNGVLSNYRVTATTSTYDAGNTYVAVQTSTITTYDPSDPANPNPAVDTALSTTTRTINYFPGAPPQAQTRTVSTLTHSTGVTETFQSTWEDGANGYRQSSESRTRTNSGDSDPEYEYSWTWTNGGPAWSEVITERVFDAGGNVTSGNITTIYYDANDTEINRTVVPITPSGTGGAAPALPTALPPPTSAVPPTDPSEGGYAYDSSEWDPTIGAMVYTRTIPYTATDNLQITATVYGEHNVTHRVQLVGPNSSVTMGNGQVLDMDFEIMGPGILEQPNSDGNQYFRFTTSTGAVGTFRNQYDDFSLVEIIPDTPYGTLRRSTGLRFDGEEGYCVGGELSFYTMLPDGNGGLTTDRHVTIQNFGRSSADDDWGNTIRFYSENGGYLHSWFGPNGYGYFVTQSDPSVQELGYTTGAGSLRVSYDEYGVVRTLGGVTMLPAIIEV